MNFRTFDHYHYHYLIFPNRADEEKKFEHHVATWLWQAACSTSYDGIVVDYCTIKHAQEKLHSNRCIFIHVRLVVCFISAACSIIFCGMKAEEARMQKNKFHNFIDMEKEAEKWELYRIRLFYRIQNGSSNCSCRNSLTWNPYAHCSRRE